MNKNAKDIAIIISAFLIVVVSITLGLKMNKDKKGSISNKNSMKNNQIEIEDTCEEGLSYPDAIEEYYKDDKYVCSFNQIRSGCYVVKVDGKTYPLKDALNNKVITVEDAIEKGLYCKKINASDNNEESNDNEESNPNTNKTSNSNVVTNTNSNTNIQSNSNISTNTNSNTNISSNKVSNSNVISNSNIQQNTLSVVDKCGQYTTQQIDEFYQDNEYIYYFTSGRSGCTYVNINGKEYTIKEALNNNLVTMKALEAVGFKCQKKSRNLADK